MHKLKNLNIIARHVLIFLNILRESNPRQRIGSCLSDTGRHVPLLFQKSVLGLQIAEMLGGYIKI